jgi:hypothetical protein
MNAPPVVMAVRGVDFCAQRHSGLDLPRFGSKGRVAVQGDARYQALEATVGIRFVGIDPDTGGNNCPAVFLDDETGDLLFQGWTVTISAELAEMGAHSPLADDETVVRIPARMRAIIREAIDDGGRQPVRRAD